MGDARYDLPLIIGHSQSLHNTENSAPSHVEHPRSLSSSPSTHGFMCLYSAKSELGGFTQFILEVSTLPSGPIKTTSQCFKFRLLSKLCVSGNLIMQSSFPAIVNADPTDETRHL